MAALDYTTLLSVHIAEEWRPVPQEFDPDGSYAVSNFGRVRRVKPTNRGRPLALDNCLRPWLEKKGYPNIELHGRTLKVHRLVAIAFLGPEPPGHEVNHKDGNKAHNVATNLEYKTHDGNMKHAGATGLMERGTARHGAKLDEEAVRAIRAARGIVFQHVLAKRYGVTEAYICNIQARRKWAWLE